MAAPIQSLNFINLKYIYYILSLVLLQGCYPVQLVWHENATAITKENVKELNGYYTNQSPEGSSYNSTLWEQLTLLNINKITNSACSVQLEVINEKWIHAKLWCSNSVIADKTIKGKVKQGYLVARRKSKWMGVPAIFYVSNGMKLQICKDSSDNLFIYTEHSKYGNVFFFSAGSTDHNKYSYKKLQQ